MTHKIALITDSTSDISAELIEQYDITVVPLYVLWGDEQLTDGEDITSRAFYERLPKDDTHPTTSQPTPMDFKTALEKVMEAGAQEAVIVTISSALSGTYSSAMQAHTMVDIPVHVVDSKTTSMGLGWQVIAGARAREDGADAEGMVAAINKARENMTVVLYVDTLEYLHKGGRIGGAAKLVGTALNLKPQLYVDHEKGTVEAGARTRTKKKAHAALYKSFFEEMDTSKKMYIGVMNGNAEGDAQEFVEKIKKEYDNVELMTSMVSPVIGVHTGPGAIAICGYYDE
jgi:DegV family protein with EDD domain